MSSAPSPAVQRVIDFVNTRDVEDGTDQLHDPASLGRWLADQGLLDSDAVLTAADVRQVQRVREALRHALEAHHGTDAAEADLEVVNAVLAAVPLQLRVRRGGEIALGAAGDGVAGALGRLLAAIPAAAGDGTFQRAKVCPNDTCQWAFYDQSRNRSRRWCSMEVCGNREKSRTFRRRQVAD